MSKTVDWGLIDHFIDEYINVINDDKIGHWVQSGMILGLITVLGYYNVGSSELGEERLKKLSMGGNNDNNQAKNKTIYSSAIMSP